MKFPIFFSENQIIESLPITDRCIHYGDGLFETIAIANNLPMFMHEHLQRLAKACLTLKIPIINLKVIAADVENFLQQFPQQQAILKILVTRGSGGRGYAPPKDVQPRIIFGLYDWPVEYAVFAKIGVKVFLCKTQLACNNHLAGIKHLNRLEQVLARLEFNSEEYQEGLMFSSNGSLIEGTMSNIFIFKDKQLLTPKLDFCGVVGIMRNRLLVLATALGFSCAEQELTKDILFTADEVFLCNSLIEIWPVIQIMERKYSIGKNTEKLINALKQERSSYEL